jgi:hypothetical protein
VKASQSTAAGAGDRNSGMMSRRRSASARLLAVTACLWVVAVSVYAEPESFVMPKTGKKFSPIGLWGGWPAVSGDPTDYNQRMQLHFPDMAAAGFNLTNLWVSSNPSSANLQKVIDTLNAAEANGVYLKIRIHEFVRYRDWPARRSDLETFINAVEEHNALFCYDSVDEPELGGEGGVLLTDLVDMKNWVALKDSHNRRVWCNQADIIQVQSSGSFQLTDPNDTTYADGVGTLTCTAYDFACFYPLYGQWATAGNVFSMDIYPVGHPWHEANLKMNAVAEGFKIHRDSIIPLTGLNNPPQGMVLQAYSVDGVAAPPQAAQTRFMAYDVITQGCKSIEWWGQASRLDIAGKPEDAACWEGIKTVAGQLAALENILAAATTATTGYTVSSGLHALCKEYRGAKVLIVTNPRDTAFNGGGPTPISVSSWAQSRVKVFSEQVSGSPRILAADATGTFTDTFLAWGVHVYADAVASLDMGAADVERGLTRVVVGDGDTVAETIGGREARRNLDPSSDYYFYFDAFGPLCYRGSNPDLYVLVRYYDTGSGALGLEYDASDGNKYKSGGTVTLVADNTWKQHLYHVADAYFGDRQNNGADFRIAKYGGGIFYLDAVEVHPESPLPDQPSNPNPQTSAVDVSRTADLSWNPADKAASYNVHFGTTNPPPFVGNQTETTFHTGPLAVLTPHYWRVDAVNSYGTTAGPVWTFDTRSYPGDFDKDADVDQEDFGLFQRCLSGEGQPYPAGCAYSDMDGDSDVDLNDFGRFQDCMEGPNQPSGC